MSNVRIAQRYLSEKGFKPHQVAGIIGNLQQESGPGLKTAAVGDGGNAYGIAQWNGPRRRAFKAYAAKRGKKPNSLIVQLDYLVHELNTTERGAMAALQKTRTAAEAAKVFSEKFERPGTPHLARRVRYAQALAGESPSAIPVNMPAEISASGGADTLIGGDDDDVLAQEIDIELKGGGIEALDDALLDTLIEDDRKADLANEGFVNVTDLLAGTPLGATLAALRRQFPDIGGGADAFVKGTSAGFSDELVGQANALVHGGDAERFTQAQRARDAEFKDNNPNLAAGLEIAGNITAAAPIGFGAAASLPARVAIGAGEGAAFGLVEGAGNADGRPVVQQALGQGAAGAGLGAAVPVVGAALAPVARPVANAVGDVLRPVGNALGLGRPAEKAADMLQGALAADGRLARRVRGKPQALVDIGGPTTKRLAEDAIAVPGGGSAAAEEFLENRVATQANRVMRDVQEAFGQDPDLLRGVQDIIERRSAQVRPIYNRLERMMVTGDAELTRQLQANSGVLRGAMLRAVNTIEDLNDAAYPALRAALEAGDVTNLRIPFRVLDLTKKELDRAARFGETPAGFAAQQQGREAVAAVRRRFLDHIDPNLRGYASARRIFSDETALVDAAQEGARFLRGDADQVAFNFSNLSQAERDAFNLGAASAVRARIEKVADGADAANKIINSKDLRRRLFALSGTPTDYKRLIRSLRAERGMAVSRNDVLKGSPTKRRLTAQDAFGGAAQIAENFAMGGSTNALPNIVRALIRRSQGMDPRTAQKLSEFLTNQDIDGVLRMLRDRGVQRALLRRENLAGLGAEQRRILSRAITAGSIDPLEGTVGNK